MNLNIILSKRSALIGYLILSMIVLLILFIYPKWTVDDAYITFRYADNFATQGELTFNVGEDPVEGYTGILLPLSIAGAIKLGVSPILASQIIGFVSFIIVLFLFHKLLCLVSSINSLRLAFLSLFATSAFFYAHVFAGLETMLFIALLMGSAVQLHTLLKNQTTALLPYALISISLLALSACRPEGAVYTILLVMIITGFCYFKLKSFKPFMVLVFVLMLPGIIYFLWRWQYYGFFLPNTFYAKLTSGFSQSTWWSCITFAEDYLVIPIVAMVLSYLLLFRQNIAQIKAKRTEYASFANLITLGSLLLFTAILLFQYFRSHLEMNYSYRFYAPLYPIALLLLAWALTPCLDTIKNNIDKIFYKGILISLVILFIAQFGHHIQLLLKTEMPLVSDYDKRLHELNIAAGHYVHDRVDSSEWLVVHVDAGAIPFFSRLQTIDFGNLNDEYLTHHKKETQGRLDYFFAKNPGVLVFTSRSWTSLEHGDEADRIKNDPRFKNYALVKKFNNSTGHQYFEFVFLRRDLLNNKEEIDITQDNRHKSKI